MDRSSSRTTEMRGVEGEEERVLSIHLYSGRLGAALYSTETFRLDLMNDLPDKGPDFSLVRTLIQQVEPHYLLVSAHLGGELHHRHHYFWRQGRCLGHALPYCAQF